MKGNRTCSSFDFSCQFRNHTSLFHRETLQSGWPIGQVNQARGKGGERGHVRSGGGGVAAAIAVVRVWLSSSGISLALVGEREGRGERREKVGGCV